jgi:toxin FitB
VLCDTNIISEMARPRPNSGVLAWASMVSSIALSVISVEEIFYGLAWKPHLKIRAWFDEFFDNRCTILPVTAAIAKRCGHLRGELQAKGRTCTQAGMLIAATAQVHQLTLVTRNVQDFTDCHIPLLNPFHE